MIKRFKAWNKWRKQSLNNPLYKMLVLLSLAHSPTFIVGYLRETAERKEE